jgi:hypothetical protein
MSNDKDPSISSDAKENVLDKVSETINADGSVTPGIGQEEEQSQSKQGKRI